MASPSNRPRQTRKPPGAEVSVQVCSHCAVFGLNARRPKPLMSVPCLIVRPRGSLRGIRQATWPSPRSTTANCAGDNLPRVRMSFAWGIVMRFCASKTLARRKATVTDASNREPRAFVVCGTIVTSARSRSSVGMPITSAGRTFATRPRSTSQTSPRCGGFTSTARVDRAQRRGGRRPLTSRRDPANRAAPMPLAAAVRPELPLGSDPATHRAPRGASFGLSALGSGLWASGAHGRRSESASAKSQKPRA